MFGLDENGKTRLHRAIRNQVLKGVLPTVADENDHRGTLLFDDNAAAAAILLLVMADMAIDVRGLRDAASFMFDKRFNTEKPIKPGKVARLPSQIEEALVAIREGKTVELVTKLVWHAGTADVTRTTLFEIEGEEPEGKAAEIIAAHRAAFEFDLAELRVPASNLLTVFLELGAE